MKLEGHYTFDAPPQVVWDCLLDPEVLAAVLPGCDKLELVEGVYEGILKIKVGPVQGKFKGKVKLSDQVAPTSYAMKVDGKGAPGFVKADATVRLEAEGDDQTVMHYDADAKVGGRIASVGQRLIDASAKAIIKQSLEGLHANVKARAEYVRELAAAEGAAAEGAAEEAPAEEASVEAAAEAPASEAPASEAPAGEAPSEGAPAEQPEAEAPAEASGGEAAEPAAAEAPATEAPPSKDAATANSEGSGSEEANGEAAGSEPAEAGPAAEEASPAPETPARPAESPAAPSKPPVIQGPSQAAFAASVAKEVARDVIPAPVRVLLVIAALGAIAYGIYAAMG